MGHIVQSVTAQEHGQQVFLGIHMTVNQDRTLVLQGGFKLGSQLFLCGDLNPENAIGTPACLPGSSARLAASGTKGQARTRTARQHSDCWPTAPIHTVRVSPAG